MFSRQKGRILLPSFRNLSENRAKAAQKARRKAGKAARPGFSSKKEAPVRAFSKNKQRPPFRKGARPDNGVPQVRSLNRGSFIFRIRLKKFAPGGELAAGDAPAHCSAYALKSSSQAGNLRRSEMGLPLWSIKQWALLPLARRVPEAASRISYSSSNFTPV